MPPFQSPQTMIREDFVRIVLAGPFGIFYVVESNRIVVHAVPDLRQDSEKIRERFSE